MPVAAVVMTGASLASCERFFEQEDDCDPHLYLQFVFDRNMYYNDDYMVGADAFAAQVSSVDVYVFNPKTGSFITHLAEKGEPLRQPGYRMPLDLPAGEYEFIAWCGLADNEGDFTVPQYVQSSSELKCLMNRKKDSDGTAYSDRNLHDLYHGSVTHTFPDTEGEHTATVNLTKDTNHIQLALQHYAGPLNPEEFEIKITDANGYLGSNNAVLEDETIEYRPWGQRFGIVDMSRANDDNWYYDEEEENKREDTNYLVSEFTTSRLMADRNPIFTVYDKVAGEMVFSIPLVKYILMMKSERYSRLQDQEYLDREDEYDFMVILENRDKEGWFGVQIVINGWHVVNNGNVGL